MATESSGAGHSTHVRYAIICAWCRDTLGVAHDDAAGDSYSICPPCVAHFFPEEHLHSHTPSDPPITVDVPARKHVTYVAEASAAPGLHQEP